MREQSHKDEMATALRGDFARLRARGVATTLAPDEMPPEPEPVAPVAPALSPEALVAPGEQAAAPVPSIATVEPEPSATAGGGWLARLRRR